MRKRFLGMVLVLFVGLLLVGGCFGPVVRPTAEFTWCPDGKSGLLAYRFISHATTVPGHYITSLSWEFGDEPVVDGYAWDVARTFPEEGTYWVTLTATDDRGVSGTATKEVLVIEAAIIRSWQLTLGFPQKVTGEVVNRHTETLQTVTVKAKFYNADEVRLTDGTIKVTGLEPGEIARFTIEAQEPSTGVFYATVFVESFVADCPDSVFWPE